MSRAAVDRAQKCLLMHFVPIFGFGGVEFAAAIGTTKGGGQMHVHFLATARQGPETPASDWITQGPIAKPFGLAAMLRGLKEIRRQNPDVLVFSLWQSVAVFLVAKMLYRKKKFVLFLHLTQRIHIIDAVATRLMLMFSDEVWADSAATLKAQVPQGKLCRVISMRIYEARSSPKRVSGTATFVSWCRLNRQKRIDRALTLLAALKKTRRDIRYTVIGPDDDCLKSLEEMVEELDLTSEVLFVGGQGRSFIERAADSATFYLQLSDYEGQAMAVVEAMQLGLIPVVTPVGAIPDYCVDGMNSVIVTHIDVAVQRICSLLADRNMLDRMSAAAQSTFADEPSYTATMLAAARELVSSAACL